jgi:hypothetical protein
MPFSNRLIFKPMELKIQQLKELYEKDFLLWLEENLKLLENREYDLVDWENLLEEIRDMGQRHLDAVISQMARIMEHLYKWENYRYREYVGNSWINSIHQARGKLELAFKRYPSLRAKARDRKNIQTAWEVAVSNLIRWFENPKNHDLARKYFGRIPTGKDFPKDCPYTFEQILEYKPWLKDKT